MISLANEKPSTYGKTSLIHIFWLKSWNINLLFDLYQTDVIKWNFTAVDWRKEKFDFGVGRWMTTRLWTWWNRLPESAICTILIASCFWPKSASPSFVSNVECFSFACKTVWNRKMDWKMNLNHFGWRWLNLLAKRLTLFNLDLRERFHLLVAVHWRLSTFESKLENHFDFPLQCFFSTPQLGLNNKRKLMPRTTFSIFDFTWSNERCD